MWGDGGIHEEDDGSYVSANVGDDEGKKEYPFVTSASVLSVMRRLYDFQKKQLANDFIMTACDYESCPKGSKDSRLSSIPGPYYSCPMLHESGDDFFSLPIPRRPGKFKFSPPFMRRSKRKTNCQKCSLVTFNHNDSSIYYENYLKDYTYAKLKANNAGHSIYNRNSEEQSSEQKFSDEEEEESQTDHSYIPPSWKDGKESLNHSTSPRPSVKTDPTKPEERNIHISKPTAINQNNKKRVKTAMKLVVPSRYKEIPRRSRPNVNIMHVNQRLTDRKSGFNKTSQDEQGESEDKSKNPFPMPDMFEEIYFGKMPESLNFLPVPLQNFKKIQMKMAESSPKPLESHKQIPLATTPELYTPPSTTIINCRGRVPVQDSSNYLPPIVRNTTPSPQPIPVNVPSTILKTGIRCTDSVARAIDKTAEAALSNINSKDTITRKTISFHSNRIRTVTSSGGKKKVLVLPVIRPSSRKIGSSQQKINCCGHSLMTKKNKSHAGLTQSKETMGNGKSGKKKKLSKLTSVESRKNLNGDSNDCRFDGLNFHDAEGKFDVDKYRESLIHFIEQKAQDESVPDGDSVKNRSQSCLPNSRSTFKRKKQGKLKKEERKELSQTSPIAITIYKSALPSVTNSVPNLCPEKSSKNLAHSPRQEKVRGVTATTGVLIGGGRKKQESRI